MKDVDTDPPLIFAPSHCKIRYEPLGVALVIGSWNFPYFVTLKPLIVAIAAGNCVIVKPSELGPCSGRAIQILVEKYLDQRCYRTIIGEIDVGKKLTQSKFDIMCFTGSTFVGSLIAQEAAKNLVPCILELGGKCPFIMDESSDLDYSAKKILCARF